MKQLRLPVLIVCVLLVAMLVIAPGALRAQFPPQANAQAQASTPTPAAPGTGDFQPRLNENAANQAITNAQQADAAQRALLNPTPPDGLPLVRAFFTEPSKHSLSDRVGFLAYWREHGGVLIFGYPLSEETIENGRIVQYFERSKFEYHPEAYGTDGQVQTALLGTLLTQGRQFAPGAPDGGELFYPETGHTLSGNFRRFWEKRGGLPTFGFPISEPFQETSTIDGQERTVQYFERAKFEFFPEELDSFFQQQVANTGLHLAALREVQLADLGRQAAKAQGKSFADAPQFPAEAVLSPSLWRRHIDVNLSTQQLVAYEDDTPVFHAPVATGRDGLETPTGTYAIYDKLPMQDMVGSLASESWYVPHIPWVQYVVGGVALHGTWWHDQWGTGTRMSHGCMNLNIDDAQWLYEWADIGTEVDIHY